MGIIFWFPAHNPQFFLGNKRVLVSSLCQFSLSTSKMKIAGFFLLFFTLTIGSDPSLSKSPLTLLGIISIMIIRVIWIIWGSLQSHWFFSRSLSIDPSLSKSPLTLLGIISIMIIRVIWIIWGSLQSHWFFS